MSQNITPERRRQLAEKHKIHEQYLYQCLTGRRDMSPAQAMALETETQGELTRQMLCQKTYAGIWKDLTTKPPLADLASTESPAAEAPPPPAVKPKGPFRRATGQAVNDEHHRDVPVAVVGRLTLTDHRSKQGA